MKIGVIIQARMGSTRLPGKILKQIGEKTLLEHIINRLTYLHHTATVVVATSTYSRDDIVEAFCRTNNIQSFRGSDEDVLERYYLCAKKYSFQHIIRLTADNPFTDIVELDNLINLHLKTGADYSYSFGELPIGVGAEMFTFDALEKSFVSGTSTNQREHVNEYVLENPVLFKISKLTVPIEKASPDTRLTIDDEEDYKKAIFIVENSQSDYVTTEEAINLCSHYA